MLYHVRGWSYGAAHIEADSPQQAAETYRKEALEESDHGEEPGKISVRVWLGDRPGKLLYETAGLGLLGADEGDIDRTEPWFADDS